MGLGLFDEIEEFLSIESKIDEVLGYSIRELCQSDSGNRLHETRYTQPALFVVNALHHFQEKKRHPNPSAPTFLAGHSLGEYNALLAAGAFDLLDALRMVKRRGELMSQARNGGMSAVIGLDPEIIARVLRDHQLSAIDVANFNSPGQTVISGLSDALKKAAPALEAAGARMVVPLAVSAAFHSRFMRDAAREFDDFLEGFSFRPLQQPVIANVTACPYPDDPSGASVRALLVEQIYQPVQWSKTIQYLLAQGVSEFCEAGPGNVLTKLVQQIRSSPSPVALPAPAAPETPSAFRTATASRPSPSARRTIFLFAGQGSQYFQMGASLYTQGGEFTKTMDQMDAVARKILGRSVISVIYGDRAKHEPFDDILFTTPAIFMVEYALARMLMQEGVQPDLVLGASLGSFVASAVAGCLAVEDALTLALRTAEVFRSHCEAGAMIAILGDPKICDAEPLRRHSVIAARNFASNFIVSVKREHLTDIEIYLKAQGYMFQRLPVLYPFHSPWIDSTRPAFAAAARTVRHSDAKIPIACCAHAATLTSLPPDYFWTVAREPIQFQETISCLERGGPCCYVDLTPSGSLATNLKYLLPKTSDSRFHAALTPYADATRNLNLVLRQLADQR